MTDPAFISRLDLERYVLGRLDSDAQAALDAQFASDPDLLDRMERVRSDIDAARQDLPSFVIPDSEDAAPRLQVLPEVSASSAVRAAPVSARSSGRGRGMRWVMAATALAAAAGVAITVVPLGDTASTETFRGSFELEVLQVRAGQASAVGALVDGRDGDMIQYTVTPSADGWWMVVDIQDDGEVTMWTPPRPVVSGQAATAAVQLDDYRGSERAYFILTEAPMELDVVRGAYADAYRTPLAELDTLPALPGKQRSILIVRTPTVP